jgi:hypothetical protein
VNLVPNLYIFETCMRRKPLDESEGPDVDATMRHRSPAAGPGDEIGKISKEVHEGLRAQGTRLKEAEKFDAGRENQAEVQCAKDTT